MVKFVVAFAAMVDAAQLRIYSQDCGGPSRLDNFPQHWVTSGHPNILAAGGSFETEYEESSGPISSIVIEVNGVQLASCDGDASADILCELPLGAGSITFKEQSLHLNKAWQASIEFKLGTDIPEGFEVYSHIASTSKTGHELICLNVTGILASAPCTGTADLVVSEPHCFQDRFGSHMMADLDVIIHDLGDDGAGHMEVTGNFVEVGGLDDFACSNKPFTKAGQNITPDFSDCRDVFMTDIQYCPDQGSVQMTSSAEPRIPEVRTLSRVPCSSACPQKSNCCTGAELVVSEPRCYHGFTGGRFTDYLDVKIHDLGAGGAGHMEVSGGYLGAAFTCPNEDFTKTGQKISADLSDCQTTGLSIPEIAYCSDQDSVRVMIKPDIPDPFHATLSRVACSSREAKAVAVAAPTKFPPPPANMEVSV